MCVCVCVCGGVWVGFCALIALFCWFDCFFSTPPLVFLPLSSSSLVFCSSGCALLTVSPLCFVFQLDKKRKEAKKKKETIPEDTSEEQVCTFLTLCVCVCVCLCVVCAPPPLSRPLSTSLDLSVACPPVLLPSSFTPPSPPSNTTTALAPSLQKKESFRRFLLKKFADLELEKQKVIDRDYKQA